MSIIYEAIEDEKGRKRIYVGIMTNNPVSDNDDALKITNAYVVARMVGVKNEKIYIYTDFTDDTLEKEEYFIESTCDALKEHLTDPERFLNLFVSELRKLKIEKCFSIAVIYKDYVAGVYHSIEHTELDMFGNLTQSKRRSNILAMTYSNNGNNWRILSPFDKTDRVLGVRRVLKDLSEIHKDENGYPVIRNRVFETFLILGSIDEESNSQKFVHVHEPTNYATIQTSYRNQQYGVYNDSTDL